MERNTKKDPVRYGKSTYSCENRGRKKKTESKRIHNRVNRLRYCHPAFWALGRGDD